MRNTAMLCMVAFGLAGLARDGVGQPKKEPKKKPPPGTVIDKPKPVPTPGPMVDAPKPVWEMPVVNTVIEKPPKGVKFPKPKIRIKPTKVVERKFTRKDAKGLELTVKLRATTAVKAELLDLIEQTLVVERIDGAKPTAKLGESELKLWRAKREEIEGGKSEIQVQLIAADGSIDVNDYTFIVPENFELIRPGVIQVSDRYRDLVLGPRTPDPFTDHGIIRQPLHHEGVPHNVLGTVTCQGTPLPFVAVVANGRKAFTDALGNFSIGGPFTGIPGTIYIAYEANVPLSSAAGAPTAPLQIFDDFHRTRNDRVDMTPTTAGSDSSFGSFAAPVTDCWLWQRGVEALRRYFTIMSAAPPAGALRLKRWSAVFASAGAAPHTFYDYVVVTTDMASLNLRTAFFHEFGHSIRHVADGPKSYWDWDNVRFIYGRVHDGTQVTGKGFVFNEGWGNYWTAVMQGLPVGIAAGAPPTSEPSFIDFNEDRVGQHLMRMSTAIGPAPAGPRFMVQVLLENPGVIHTLQQFEQRYCAKLGGSNAHCNAGVPIRVVPSCPNGYADDGLTCRLINIISRPQSFTVGTTPSACPAGQEEQLGLCYPRCPAGFNGELAMCVQPCPAGYNDDGLTCHRYAHIFGSDNSACPGYDICGVTFARGCSVCPPDYNNDGCTCRRDPHIIAQNTTWRGAGSIPIGCVAGMENIGGLCYPVCPAGMTRSGLICYGNCPDPSWTQHPATCYKDPNVFADDPVIPP